jgi:hypothetical protein
MSEARGFLGAGDLYIDRQVNGVYQGLKGPFECSKFEIKANSTLKDKRSKGKSTYSQIIETVAVPEPFELSVTLGEMNTDGMALALLGTTSSTSQGAGTLTAETFVAKLDVWVPVSKQNLTGSQTVTNAAASTTYVNGTDYIVNKTLGLIKALPGGAIADLASLRLTSGYGAIASTLIRGATNPVIRAKFVLDGINFADNTPTIVTVYEAVIASDAAVDFLSDEFGEIPLPGRMKTPTGFNEPFLIERRAA